MWKYLVAEGGLEGHALSSYRTQNRHNSQSVDSFHKLIAFLLKEFHREKIIDEYYKNYIIIDLNMQYVNIKI